jgi:hypothetical protein
MSARRRSSAGDSRWVFIVCKLLLNHLTLRLFIMLVSQVAPGTTCDACGCEGHETSRFRASTLPDREIVCHSCREREVGSLHTN